MARGAQQEKRLTEVVVDLVPTADFFRERARRADVAKALTLLDRLGGEEPLRPGDEIE